MYIMYDNYATFFPLIYFFGGVIHVSNLNFFLSDVKLHV